MRRVTKTPEWRLADAKNKFSEVCRKAVEDGPQLIQRRDEPVIVIAKADYDNLVKPKKSLVEYIMEGPSLEGLDLTRDKSLARDIEF